MKIQWNLVLVFSTIMIVTIGVFSYVTLEIVKESFIETDLLEMQKEVLERELLMQNLHDRASEDLVFALKNPLFVEYFELPETKAGNVYEDGVLQFTDRQREIKTKLEQHVFNFQNKFQVDETCIIDMSGQEHARLVLNRIEVDENLSPDEKEASFFEPSFQKNKDEVHIEYPYISPDTYRWVFAYTSPVVLGDESKPAIFHFEMPVALFQEIVNVEHGRMYVVDTNGFIIADSEHQYPTASIPETFEEFFPTIDSVFPPSFAEVMNEMKDTGDGETSYLEDGETYYLAYKELPTFGWYLLYQEDEELILSEHQTAIGTVQYTIGLVASMIIFGGILSIIVISDRITKPIVALRNATKEIEDGLLDIEIKSQGADELKDLSKSFEKMIKSIKKTIDLEKELAITQAELKNEKLASIGALSARLAHDLRNPLSVIKSAHELLKLKTPNQDAYTKEKYKQIENAISRITHQIDNVLDFVRIKPLELRECHVKEVINSAIKSVQIPDTINLIAEGDNPKILCDEKSIEIVLLNLIDNSIQALDGHGDITILVTDTNENILIQVEDNGPGIKEEQIDKIFEPLFTTKQRGTGLGLSSCKSIIQQHGGEISVRNNPTTFTIRLPKRVVEKIENE